MLVTVPVTALMAATAVAVADVEGEATVIAGRLKYPKPLWSCTYWLTRPRPSTRARNAATESGGSMNTVGADVKRPTNDAAFDGAIDEIVPSAATVAVP